MMGASKEPAGMSGELSGIVRGMPDPDYRKVDAISKSGLDLIDESPRKYQHVMIEGNKPEPSAAMKLGSAFDCYLLEPEVFAKRFLVIPSGMRRGTKAWDEFEKESEGRELVKAEEFEEIKAMRDAVRAHPVASKILSDGDAQVSYFWRDPITGLRCKARADYRRNDGILVDVKSTADGGGKPEVFQRTALAMRYHAQAAFYSDGAEIVDLKPAAFLFVVVERAAPYHVAIYSMTDDFIHLGREAYRKDLETFAACKAENVFPGYSTLIEPLSPPAWAFKKGN
jgi:hypothetical protein